MALNQNLQVARRTYGKRVGIQLLKQLVLLRLVKAESILQMRNTREGKLGTHVS